MPYTKLTPRFTPDAGVEEISSGSAYRLSISAGSAQKYRLAQLDDYTQIPRSRFPLRFPLNFSLRARVSSNSIPGTWGFGLWNDPFGLSLGFGGNPFRLPALPNALWFFGASKESYLSFKEPLRPKQRHAIAANGFIAQTFRAPKFHLLLILVGLAFPFSRKLTRRMLGKVIDEDGLQLSDHEVQQQAIGVQSQGVDPTQWHRYRLEWRDRRVRFEVDDIQVFESSVSPRPPLGLVIWLDNQYAAFTPEGKIGFGVLENPGPAWLEIKELEVG
ncbi:MAG TPA: hypothetical protein VFD54_06875 [Anaerolineales bacterium]|jgi:hypothetical protein|nr:hypothetical protein [Anaerolineales bacterium]